MSHMFSISDNEAENSDDAADQNNPGENPLPEIILSGRSASLAGPELERLRLHAASKASTSTQGEEDELPGGGVFEEGGEEGQGFRTRSRSAPPELWAAMHYGRQLRRMSDEFDTLFDKAALRKVRSAAAAKQMRTSFSWFNFWRRRDTENDLDNSDSGADNRSAE